MPGLTSRTNGKSFDSGDATVAMFGQVEEEWQNISYSVSQEHQLNHTGNNKATSYGMGKITYEGSVTLMMAAVRKYEKAGQGNLLQLKPFQTTVTYINDDQEETTDSITWKFMKQGREVGGEMGLAYQYDMFVLDIQFGVS